MSQIERKQRIRLPWYPGLNKHFGFAVQKSSTKDYVYRMRKNGATVHTDEKHSRTVDEDVFGVTSHAEFVLKSRLVRVCVEVTFHIIDERGQIPTTPHGDQLHNQTHQGRKNGLYCRHFHQEIPLQSEIIGSPNDDVTQSENAKQCPEVFANIEYC